MRERPHYCINWGDQIFHWGTKYITGGIWNGFPEIFGPRGDQIFQGTKYFVTDFQEDIAVQNNGNSDLYIAERQKGLFITAENTNDELTVYVLNDEIVSSDAYMAINCVEFPNAKNYKYFIFSSDVFGGEPFESRFLFTPCEDGTTVSVQASQTQTHPNWVQSSV